MRVALVHDYIKEYGGAERVLEALSDMFPSAPIYTSVYLPQFLGPHRTRFEKKKIQPSWLQYIPFKGKLISPFRLISPWVFGGFDLSSYDVIIVSQTGAYFPNRVKKGKSTLITYTHTPPRYLYGYMTARNWKKNKFFAILGETANHFLRIIDFNAAKNVDYFIANSEEIKGRIQKFYRRDAVVINPPVDVKVDIKPVQEKEEYFVTGGRLARAKGFDIIVDAFNNNKLPLKIFGKGFAGFEEELKQRARNNIEFVGEVTDEEKYELLKKAKAFIFASYDEDFGITPIEAMSVGCPVLAYKSGGVKETVIEGETGVFFEENTPTALNNALEKLNKKKIQPEMCIKHAQKFSKERFIKEITAYIKKVA